MKLLVKKIVHSLGWDLHRLSPAYNVNAQILAALNYVQSNIVFDVGANIGHFAQGLRSVGYLGKIISFEPLSNAHVQLSAAARNDPEWLVHPRTALGDRDGVININIAENSVSSSVLPMLQAHSTAALGSAYIGAESTTLVRLDSIAEAYLDESSRPFIKIDTQGFEWQVLDGAVETLNFACGVLLELSLVSLYEGQHLWGEIIDRMDSEGFMLWALQKGFTDPITGRSLQMDGIFLRRELIR